MNRCLLGLIGLGFLLIGNITHAIDFHQSIQQMIQEIEQKQAELKTFRQEMVKQRIINNQELRALQNEVAQLRQEDHLLQSFRYEKDSAFNQIQEAMKDEQNNIHLIQSETLMHRRKMMKSVSFAKEQWLSLDLKKIDNQLEVDVISAIPLLMDFSQHYLNLMQGVQLFEGEALDLDGKIYLGTFISLGPVEYFLSHDQILAGIVGLGDSSLKPTVIFSMKPQILQDLILGQKTQLPMDFTQGRAIQIKNQSSKTFWEELCSGGVVMGPIIGLMFICLIVSVIKVINLSKLRLKGGFNLNRIIVLIHQNKINEAKTHIEKFKKPLAPVLLEGLEYRHAPKEDIEEIMHEHILSQIPSLEKGLSLLSVSAAAAPLLGLLGTVMGMMRTFNLIAVFGSGQANLLSGGISEALVTTKYGLFVAIPALLLHAYFSRRVKGVIHTMEQTAMAFCNGLTVKMINQDRHDH